MTSCELVHSPRRTSDATPVTNLDASDAAALLEGAHGSTVTLGITRQGMSMVFLVTREHIPYTPDLINLPPSHQELPPPISLARPLEVREQTRVKNTEEKPCGEGSGQEAPPGDEDDEVSGSGGAVRKEEISQGQEQAAMMSATIR